MTFTITFVTGATPDKWAGTWRQRDRERIELVPVDEAAQLHGVHEGVADMALVRLPVDRERLHLIPLYDERAVAVMGVENALSLLEEVTEDDIAEEEVDWAVLTPKDAVSTVASETGVVVMPMSVARLHHRKDVTYRPVSDRPGTTVGLAWLEGNEDPRVQKFIGIVRGRSERSTRG